MDVLPLGVRSNVAGSRLQTGYFVPVRDIAYNGALLPRLVLPLSLSPPIMLFHFSVGRLSSCRVALALGLLAVAASMASAGEIVFDRDILPILSDKCFLCHGPDAGTRQADLRFDLAGVGVEHGAIVPGKPEESPLVERITSTDADLMMPPPSAKLRLTDEEKKLLEQWIAEGAEYGEHWAFRPLPDEVAVPEVANSKWTKGELDRFIAQRFESEGLSPTERAAPLRLLRRATLALTGLPPTPEEIASFEKQIEAAGFDAAYAAAVDRLLASPAFGEQMALPWLDAARYADSHGYQSDQLNTQWPYRDWVVRALNDNLPYDQFITWQIAGDLLSNPTTDQRLATAFNRIHRMTNEGGSIAEEWRIEYAADRVHTLGSAVLGLTLECARCHDHKYDPISQRDYYAISAFFNSIDEWGLYEVTQKVPAPTLQLPTPEQAARLEKAKRGVAEAEQALAAHRANQEKAFDNWLASQLQSPSFAPVERNLIGHFTFDGEGTTLRNEAPGADAKKVYSTAGATRAEGVAGAAVRLDGDVAIDFPGLFAPDWHDPFTFDLSINDKLAQPLPCVLLHTTDGTDASFNGFDLLLVGGHLEARFYREWPGSALGVRTDKVINQGDWHRVTVTYDGSKRAAGLAIYVDGKPVELTVLRDHVDPAGALLPGRDSQRVGIGARFRDRGFKQGQVDELRVYRAALSPLEVAQLGDRGAFDRALHDHETHRQSLRDYFDAAVDQRGIELAAELTQARKEIVEVENGIQTVSVMREMSEPRPTYLLARGAYDAPKSDENRVARDVFEAMLAPFPADAPRNRLGLAQWLIDPRHPLTSRVAVNRVWMNFFGHALVSTPENFGKQGTRPSHPELLDWLARDFVDHGWDTKRLCRQIVLSATFQQDSRLTPELLERDPENLLYTRGPSYRLSSEQLRDLALASSGLLVRELGGPPVSPYQPGGDLWRESNSMSPPYHQSVGKGLYRRSLYSVWKRTAPLPNMLAFDAPTREVCTISRSRTNTPLQALVLLNDVQFVEAARALAGEVASVEPTAEVGDQITLAFIRVTGRSPDKTECQLLESLYREQLALFDGGEQQAEAFLEPGELKPATDIPANHLAALTVVCQTLLNLDAAVYSR